jgi:hypothetical protein
MAMALENYDILKGGGEPVRKNSWIESICLPAGRRADPAEDKTRPNGWQPASHRGLAAKVSLKEHNILHDRVLIKKIGVFLT